MTTIATDGLSIAADTAMFSGHTKAPWGVSKIIQEETRVFAFSGSFALLEPMITWYKDGCPKTRIPSSVKASDIDSDNSTLWIFEGGQFFEITNKYPHKLKLEVPFAMGSGSNYALSLLTWGATAYEALQVAIALDPWSGGAIQQVTLPSELVVEKPVSFIPIRGY